ncbi:MAG: hypothetical protein ACLRL4_00425 [Bifidobacterium bifidum]
MRKTSNCCENSSKRQNATVSTLRDQVRALESQADALQRQATIQEDEASVPEWELRQVQNLRHSVANNNPFDAKDVRVELSNGNEYELGDISRGSKQTSCSSNEVWKSAPTMTYASPGLFPTIYPIVSS